jgi:murein DD-endopeptidase MepM/ murein hydrolase activator NlpD
MNIQREQVSMAYRVSLGLLSFLFLAACQPAPQQDQLPTAQAQTNSDISLSTPSQLATGEIATEIPQSLERGEPTSYFVQDGDTLSSIAAQINISPQTLLWANYSELFDNPDYLLPGMDLLVLPTDGVYHQVGGADTLLSLAAFFAVEPANIVDWSANNLESLASSIQAGEWLMVPGGQRASRWRQMPNISRNNAALSAEEFGSGACEENYSASITGDQIYEWPLENAVIAAEGFTDWHSGVDLAVEGSEDVVAADDGLVVFSGWSNLGYGLSLMLDHGNGDFTLYAGLSQIVAACGHEIQQGELIAIAGATGHPSGPLLHFEIRRGENFLDPFTLISTP